METVDLKSFSTDQLKARIYDNAVQIGRINAGTQALEEELRRREEQKTVEIT